MTDRAGRRASEEDGNRADGGRIEAGERISNQREIGQAVSYTASGSAKKKSGMHPLHTASENNADFLHHTKQNLHDSGEKIKS